jgi:hypothetical protein
MRLTCRFAATLALVAVRWEWAPLRPSPKARQEVRSIFFDAKFPAF